MTVALEFIGMLEIASFEFVICKHNCINLYNFADKCCFEIVTVILFMSLKVVYEQYCKYQQPILTPNTSQHAVQAENGALFKSAL